MDTILNLEEIMIEEPSDIIISQEESKDIIVNPVMKIHIEELNYAEKIYIKAVQDMDISCKDLVSYENEKLINFEVISKIKQ